MPEQPQGQQPSPEQVEALKEKIKNMSPEELKEFQKKQCIFCQMVEGKIQVKKVYEDNKTIAILDINPGNPGHMLLLPKEHYSVMPQIPEEEVAHLFIVAKFLSNAVLKSLEASSTNIIVANGPAAGQRAQHFMIHVIPRKEGDGIKFELPQKKHSDADLDAVRDKISEKLAGILKVRKEELVKKEVKVPQIPPTKEPKKEAPKIKPPKPKVVEAVVKEEAPEKEAKSAEKAKKPRKKRKKKAPEVEVVVKPEIKVVTKPPKKKAKQKKKKAEEKPKKESKDVDLDDIARVLGI